MVLFLMSEVTLYAYRASRVEPRSPDDRVVLVREVRGLAVVPHVQRRPGISLERAAAHHHRCRGKADQYFCIAFVDKGALTYSAGQSVFHLQRWWFRPKTDPS